MLSNLRPGVPVFALYKNELRFSVGKVAQISNQYPPQPNFQQPFNPSMTTPLVDLTIEFDGKTETYPRIPVSSSVAEFPDRGVIISETRDGIVNEINVIRGASQTALDQIENHRRVISTCDQLLLDLNPQLKKEQEQSTKIERLEKQLSGMSEQIAALSGMLSKAIGKKKEEA